jgi:guanine deaminase
MLREATIAKKNGEQLALPKEQRSIKLTQLLRDEAIVVWKEYRAKPDKIHY